MVKRLGFALLITLFILGSTGLAARDGITKRVRFGKGKSSATFFNAVIRGDRDTYIYSWSKGGAKHDRPDHGP